MFFSFIIYESAHYTVTHFYTFLKFTRKYIINIQPFDTRTDENYLNNTKHC